MKTKQRIISEIERLTEDTLTLVLKYILSLEKQNPKSQTSDETSWSSLALESGSFDFWLDPEETEYTLDDLKQKK